MSKKSVSLYQLWAWLIVRFVGWLVAGSLGCVLVAIVLVALHGKPELLSLQQLLVSDYHTVSQLASPIIWHWLNQCLAVFPAKLSIHTVHVPLLSRSEQRQIGQTLTPLLNGMLLGIKLLWIRWSLLVSCWSLWMTFALVGFIDGLVQRYIRRMQVARESTLIYHSVKPMILVSLTLAMLSVLVIPVGFQQTQSWLVIALLIFAWSIQLTTKQFKKYL